MAVDLRTAATRVLAAWDAWVPLEWGASKQLSDPELLASRSQLILAVESLRHAHHASALDEVRGVQDTKWAAFLVGVACGTALLIAVYVLGAVTASLGWWSP